MCQRGVDSVDGVLTRGAGVAYRVAMPTSSASRSASRRRSPRVSGEEREQAILDTLRRLLAEHGLREIAVDDLAGGAGISRPTFYFYFASKEAALLALLEGLVEEAQRAQGDAREMLAHDRIGAWRLALGAAYGTWMANRDVIRAAAAARTSNPEVAALWTRLLEWYVQRTADAIEAERVRGAAPPGLPARDLAVCLNRMSERIYETTLGHDEPTVDDDRVLDSLLDVWLRAIYGTPPTES